jgi:predicted methyltransferase
LIGAGGLALAACGREAKGRKAASPPAPAAPPPATGSIAWAVEGPWRATTDRQRDAGLHPAETLAFFGLAPAMTVVEIWPGSGWWTQILAPYLKANAGRLVAATFETPNPEDPAAVRVVEAYKRMLADQPDLYGSAEVTAFGPRSGPLTPKGAADLVLFFHLDHWLAAGLAEKAFHDAFESLKPKGVLGLLQGRAAPGAPQDPLAANGLIEEAFVRRMAEEAGFVLKASSEINARPPGAGGGEPDRMTLTFVKARA